MLLRVDSDFADSGSMSDTPEEVQWVLKVDGIIK